MKKQRKVKGGREQGKMGKIGKGTMGAPRRVWREKQVGQSPSYQMLCGDKNWKIMLF
jgi:hypothetical protein